MSKTVDETSNQNLTYQAARRRVKELKEYYTHLMIFIVVNAGLFILNFLSTPGIWWFYWPLFGWGIGLGAHTMTTFGIGGMFGMEWEERKIQEIMKKQK